MTIISKRSRYALHGLGYIAVFSGGEAVPFEEILSYLRAYSGRLSLSPSYIAKIFQEVSRAGFTEALSGPRGGYQLARPPQDIRLIEIVESLDGPLLPGCCLLSVGECSRQSTCGVRQLVREAELTFYRFFERETVASLAQRMAFPDPATIRSYRRQRRRPTAGEPTAAKATAAKATAAKPTAAKATAGKPTAAKATAGRPTAGRPTRAHTRRK